MRQPHSLFRLSQRVYNTPHLITPQALSVVLDYFERRNLQDFRLDMSEPAEAPDDQEEDDDGMTPDIGILCVDGSLTYRPVMTLCGEVGTSYQSLVAKTEDMIETGVKTIVMWASSGGGEASHVFETANDIRSLCDENGVQLVGYADTMACSAAYALLCVCDVVIANPSADLGSIGCVVALMDTSKAMEKAGLKRIFITSGENKVPFDADGAFKDSFLEDIQAEVDRLNDEFAAHVSAHTNLSVDVIKGFEAKVFNAAEAKKRGLCDAVMTAKEFSQYLAQAKGNT